MTITITKLVAVSFTLAIVTCAAMPAHATPYNDAVLADNPFLYWNFDEAGDTDPAVSLVNVTAINNLTSIAGGTRTTSGTTNGGVSLGRAATSPNFNSRFTTGWDGANFVSGNPTITGPWAVEFWFMPANTGGQYFMASGSEQPSFIYGFDPDGTEEIEFLGNSGRFGATGVSVGEWHHVVMADITGATGEIYVDGDFAADGPFAQSLPLDFFTVGSRAAGFAGNFTGSIDEVAIYELSGSVADQQAAVADIAQHFNVAAPQVPEPSSVLIWMLIAAGVGVSVCRRRK